MTENDVSPAGLAELSGLPPQRVRRLLAGEVDPGAIELMSMAKAIGVRPGALIENLSIDEADEGSPRVG
jgi:transcriptional regulator with XRE-family HTH domain